MMHIGTMDRANASQGIIKRLSHFPFKIRFFFALIAVLCDVCLVLWYQPVRVSSITIIAIFPIIWISLLFGLPGSLTAVFLSITINGLLVVSTPRWAQIHPITSQVGFLQDALGSAVVLLAGGLLLGFSVEKDKRLQRELRQRKTAEEDLRNNRLLENALRETENKFREFFEQSSDGIFLTDEEGLFIEWNRTMERISGLPKDEVLGKPADKIWIGQGPTAKPTGPLQIQARITLGDFLKSGAAPWLNQLMERQIQRDGTVYFVQELTFPIQTEKGFMLGGVLRDVTELKRMEHAEREQHRLAEALRDTASALAGTLNFDEVLERILTNVGRVVPHDASSIMLFDSEQYYIALRHQADRKIHQDTAPVRLKLETTPVLQKMAETGKPVIIPDVRASDEGRFSPENENVRSYAGAPIRIKGETVGFLNLDSFTPDFFNPSHMERLQAFADQAAVAIENARLFSDLTHYARRTALLNEMTHLAIRSSNLQELLQTLAGHLNKLINADQTYIALLDEEHQRLLPAAAFTTAAQTPPEIQAASNELALAASVFYSGKALVEEDTRLASGGLLPASAVLGLPLLAGTHRLGAVLFWFNQPHHFTPDERDVCEQAAGQAALAIEKVQLLETERRRTAQLARANSFIKALSLVAAQIDQAQDPHSVMGTLGFELKKLGIHSLVALKAGEGSDLSVQYLSLKQDYTTRLVERNASLIKDIRISPDQFPFYHQVLEKRQSIFSQTPLETLKTILDQVPVALLSENGWQDSNFEDTKAFILPLVVKNQVLGSLWIWSEALLEDDLPAASIFATQVAVTLRNAQLYSDVQHIAITDPLTKLYNRRALYEFGRREVERSLRFHRPLSVIMLDIDHFKAVNDTYGHLVGDQILKEIAARERASIRDIDVIARYGGEEFIILLPENTASTAAQVAERIRKSIVEKPFFTDRGEVSISASIGVAELCEQCRDLGCLIAKADDALYAAKQAGRNQVVALC